MEEDHNTKAARDAGVEKHSCQIELRGAHVKLVYYNNKQVLRVYIMLHVTVVLYVRSEDERADTVSIHSSLCDNENPTTHSISMKLATRGFRETVNRLTVQLVQAQAQIVLDSRGSTLHAAKLATQAQRFLSTCPGSSRSWYQTGQPRSPS